MAKNITRTFGEIGAHNVGLKVTIPATNTSTVVPKSGTPCLAGTVPGVAEADVDTVTSITTLNTYCIAELLVLGVGVSSVNGAVSARDLIYIDSSGNLTKDSAAAGAKPFGEMYGNALLDVTLTANKLGTDTRDGQLVASGSSAICRVWVGKVNN